jgi:hypothetical protein
MPDRAGVIAGPFFMPGWPPVDHGASMKWVSSRWAGTGPTGEARKRHAPPCCSPAPCVRGLAPRIIGRLAPGRAVRGVVARRRSRPTSLHVRAGLVPARWSYLHDRATDRMDRRAGPSGRFFEPMEAPQRLHRPRMTPFHGVWLWPASLIVIGYRSVRDRLTHLPSRTPLAGPLPAGGGVPGPVTRAAASRRQSWLTRWRDPDARCLPGRCRLVACAMQVDDATIGNQRGSANERATG